MCILVAGLVVGTIGIVSYLLDKRSFGTHFVFGICCFVSNYVVQHLSTP